MCDEDSLIHAETIWKLCWKGQHLTHYAQTSLNMCGQRDGLHV